MQGVKFVDVLKSFEGKTEGEDYKKQKKGYDERKLIENDVKRTQLLGVRRVSKESSVLKMILFDCLCTISVEYVQGMSEIASVFVLHYFKDIVRKEIGVDTEETNEHVDKEEDDSVDISERFIDAGEDEKTKIKEIIKKNSEVNDVLRTVLINVFRRKFEPIVADGFKEYRRNMKVFVEMIRRRTGTRISEMECFRFMESILTFFLRNLSSVEDVHKMFEIILACPNNCPFILLVLFYEQISTKKAIQKVDDDLFVKVIEVEEEFIRTQKRTEEGSKVSRRNMLVAGGVVSVVVAIAIYGAMKREGSKG
ncbi:hypothetical protein OCOL_000133 [Ordospora colligata]|uniref:Uncharacterized protein n=1 Tax=Ordospora colligata OC4 TaxID=1354746 RepID=A0A0B2UKB7_9MICR|nr:uncharacterized protein M896_050810 [Ordospora colligata OC4]KHN69674.1 hypothetical protein M896_050810 [Ordospora colligata OC4]TBU15793.1 hypothetical protein CWI41_050800 [Ordospora colligata]